ncbi:SCO1431 family membrane protein [Streptomyces deserti]
MGESNRTTETSETYMTANSATATRLRTGGPRDDGPKLFEHAMGWTLVVVVAMFVTQLGLL